MPHIALLGAGFSRNWRGWLATEVVGELLARCVNDRDTYLRLRRSLNFEDTLADLQEDARRKGTAEAQQRLDRFEGWIIDTFTEMNRSFAEILDWRSGVAQNTIDDFLARFDEIFTLNQDMLLELHYQNTWTSPRRWTGTTYPGYAFPPNWDSSHRQEKVESVWERSGSMDINGNTQPIFKLHGSVNWRVTEGRPLLVMGGSKQQVIDRHPLLRSYHEHFTDMLNVGNTKLMVIGYGFHDIHINRLLIDAGTNHGMHMHLVNPEGIDVLNSTSKNAIPGIDPLNEIPLIGVTVRSLREAFTGDRLSHRSLMRFFE